MNSPRISISTKLFLVLFILTAILVGIGLQILFEPKNTNGGGSSQLLSLVFLLLFVAYIFILFLFNDIKKFLFNYKEREIKISENQEKFKLAFMTGMDANFISVLETGMLLEVNDYFCQLFGFTREECIGKTSAELDLYVNPSDRTKSANEILVKGYVRDVEIQCKKKNGEIFTIFFSTSLFKMNGKLHVLGIIRDITEKKKLQETLKSSEERYRSLFQYSPEGILLAKPNGEILSANPEACGILGMTETEICSIGRNGIVDISDSNLGPTIKEREISGVARTELRLIRKDGSKFPAEVTTTIYSDVNGEKFAIIFFKDITERKKAREELLVQKEQLALFIQYSPIALAMLDKDMRYLEVSERWMFDYNLGTDSIIGKSHYEIFPEITNEWKEIHRRSLNGSIEKNDEDLFLRVDGSVSWLRWEIRPWHTATGEIGGVILFTENITENKINKENLLRSREQYQNLVSKINVGVVLNTPESKIIFCNQSACTILGLTEEQLLGLSPYDNYWKVIHEDGTEYEGKDHPVSRSIAEKRPIRSVVMGVHRPSKRDLVWLLVNAIPQLNEDGSIKEVISTFEDITIRYKSEEKIRESEMRFRALSDNILVGVYIIKDNKFSYVNQRLAQIYGCNPEDLIGLNALQFIHPDDIPIIEENIRKRINGEKLSSLYEYRGIRKDGEIRILEVHGSLLNLENESYFIGSVIDITRRKEIENSVIESEEKYRYLFQNNPAYIIIWDLENLNILEVNEAIIEKYGYTREEWSCMTALDYRPKTDFERVFNLREQMLTGDHSMSRGTYLHLKKNGDEMLMEIASHKIIFQNRPAIMTLGRDVTNQVKAEAALKLSEEKFHSLVDYAADAIFMLTQDGIVFDVNKIALELFQVQRENIIGKRILDIIYADEANAENSVWDLLKINKYFSEERKWVRQNGLLVDLEIRAKMLPDGTGAITIIRDITQRKKFEEQLALVASIVNSSDDAIISKTLDGIITSWNKGAERVLGYPASTVIGNSINLFIPPNLFSEETEINKSILNGVAIEHFETVRLRKDGVLINVSLTISPIKDEFDHVIGASIIMRDITEKKKMELENDKIMSELLQRNRDLEQFSYIISHNLRLPVANIMGISDYILNAEVNDSEEIEQLNSGLSKSVHALDGVIKDLNFILQTKREISEKNTLVKFSQLCDDIRLSIANLIQSEGVVIRTNFEEVDEMLTLKSYLYSIFYNLISNSIKYKQPHIAPIIEIRSALIGTKIEIVFKDNGLGIDIEKRKEQIFGLYKRFHSHTEGKGMGLYMVKTQVETLGGKISIKSEVNQGTEFIIEFDINIHRSA